MASRDGPQGPAPDRGDGDLTSVRIRGALAGDPAGLQWIVSHFHPLVLAQVRLRLGGPAAPPEDVRDLADEVWLVTLRRLQDLRPVEGHLAPVLARFLTTTSIHLCNNHLRAEARRGAAIRPEPRAETSGSVNPDPEAAQSGVITRASRKDLDLAITGALARLSEAQRSVLVLRLLEGSRNREIAVTLGVAANTVAVTYRRALEALRKALPRSTFLELQRLRR